MNLTLLLIVAVSIPLLMVIGVLSLVRGARWFAAHPKGFACVAGVIAVVHAVDGAMQLRNGETTAGVVGLLVGVTWGVLAAVWFRSSPQELP